MVTTKTLCRDMFYSKQNKFLRFLTMKINLYNFLNQR